jgi:hypothetical protein
VARFAVLGVAAGSLLAGMTVLAGVDITASGASGNLYVSPYGSNAGGNNCQSEAAPCLTIQHAINEASPSNTINLAGGTYKGNIEMDMPLTFAGSDAGGSLNVNTTTIEGVAGADFTVNVGPKTITFENLVITGVNPVGGGIDNDGHLTLDNVNVQSNVGSCCGTGIVNDEVLTMNGGVVSGNVANLDTPGGGFANYGDATLNGVTFTHNSTDEVGGAIYNDGHLKIIGITPIHDNSATETGGGIFECNGESLSIGSGVSDTANTPNDEVHGTC